MKLIKIESNTMTVELTSQECQRLAAGCQDFTQGNQSRQVPREYAYENWDDRDWAAHKRFQERNLQSSMVQFGFEHAIERGWCADLVPSDGEMIPAPGGADVVRALATERPIAEVYAQICRDMQIEMPEQVIAALQVPATAE